MQDVMGETKLEEKSPLLFYVCDADDELSKNNKRMSFEKGRFHGITSGVTAVFTEFPNYVSTCWITTVLSTLIFFMMMLLVISSISSSSSGRIRIPRCAHIDDVTLDNRTIHLVHDSKHWDSDQLEILEKIKQLYPDFKTHLILIHDENELRLPKFEKNLLREITNENLSKTTDAAPPSTKTILETNNKVIVKKTSKRRKRRIDEHNLSLNMGVKRLLDILLHTKINSNASISNTGSVTSLPSTASELATPPKPKSLDDVLRNYPNLIVEKTAYPNLFETSPLYVSWPYLNDDLKIFAARVVELWQYGGLSFSLDAASDKKANNFSITDEKRNIQVDTSGAGKLIGFVMSERAVIDKLPFGIVTADDEGLHMVSKTPCHAFFGELMINLKNADRSTTIKDVIRESLKVFCRHAAVDRRYCDTLKND